MKHNSRKIIITLLTSLVIVPALVHFSFIQEAESVYAAPTVITTRSSQAYIDNYYASISNSLTGNTLKSSLESLLQNERSASFSYGSLQSSAFPYTDVDPNRPNGGYIVSFYSGTPVSGYSGMNKEHTWPDSHGGNRIENDPHVIRPTLTSENSSRGNQYYAEESINGWDPDTFGNPKYRGIAARIAFYGATIGHSEGLILEDVGRGQASGTGNRMGKLGDLLKWNLQYPIDQSEIIRNETLDISLNYNRNPFIDDVTLPCRIWGDTNDNTRNVCSSQSMELESLSLSPASVSLAKGTTQNITVTAQPSGASTSVIWSSSNNAVATVINGLLTAQNEGQATITATSTSNTSIKATMSVTVTPPQPPTSISVSPTTLSLPMGNVSTLNVTSSPSGTSNSVTWATSNSSVALVSNGVVSGIALGNATITATSTVNSNLVATCSVTIVEASSITKVDNYQNITEGNYFITVDSGSKYYLPMQTGGFTNGNSTITAFTDVGSINITNAWTFTGNGTNSWKISNNGYFLNSTTTNDGIGATASGISDYWVASQGSTSIMLKSNAGTRFLTAALSLSLSEWRGYGSANTNGTSNLILYRLGSGSSVPPTLESEEWAADFLNQTSLGCQNKSSVQLASVWNSVKTNYLAISEAAKMIISTATPNAFGSDVENALARYIDIVSKYDLEAFMSGVQTQSNSFPTPMIAEENMVFLLVFLAIIFLAGTMIFALTRKSKKH